MTSQDDAIDNDRSPSPTPYLALANILEFLGYSSAILTILGYFVGPFPEIIPPPWRIPLVIVGFLAVLVAASITSARATTRYLSHFDVSLTKHLDDFKSDVGNALEEATSVQANAEAMCAAAKEVSSLTHDLQKSAFKISNSDNPREYARNQIHQALTRFARTYSRLSGHEMRACIKIIKTDDKGKRVAVTLARSNTTLLDDDEYNLITHNTDFNAISAGQLMWHSSSVSTENDYQNSSPNRQYESVLGWGIRDIGRPPPTDSLVGFLCLDSVDAGAIDPDRDAPFGWWFIDAFRALCTNAPDSVLDITLSKND